MVPLVVFSFIKHQNQAYQLLKDKVLLKLEWAKNQKSKPSLKKTIAFADEDLLTSNLVDLLDIFLVTLNLTQNVAHLNLINHRKLEMRSEDEDEEPTPQMKAKDPKTVKENPIPKPYKLKIMNAKYGKFLKELFSNKYKLEQISVAFFSNKSYALIQNKVPPKLRDLRSFHIPCNLNKDFSCDALANLGASINLMPYSPYAKLSLETLKPTKISVRLADRSFQYPIGIAKNMLVKVGKLTFLIDFVILKMEEDSKVPLILGRPFLHTADAVI
ncbi:reverse transcriptase domain-containing protein [Tanacetum coccineum]